MQRNIQIIILIAIIISILVITQLFLPSNNELRYKIGECPQSGILCGAANAPKYGCTNEYQEWALQNCNITGRDR